MTLPEGFEYREGSRKVWCSVCGGSGGAGGSWMNSHKEHVFCPDCGKLVIKRGLGAHRGSMRRYGKGHALTTRNDHPLEGEG